MRQGVFLHFDRSLSSKDGICSHLPQVFESYQNATILVISFHYQQRLLPFRDGDLADISASHLFDQIHTYTTVTQPFYHFLRRALYICPGFQGLFSIFLDSQEHLIRELICIFPSFMFFFVFPFCSQPVTSGLEFKFLIKILS